MLSLASTYLVFCVTDVSAHYTNIAVRRGLIHNLVDPLYLGWLLGLEHMPPSLLLGSREFVVPHREFHESGLPGE